MGVHCCFLHINYIVYEQTVFEILGFKLKNKNDDNGKKNEEIDFLPYLPCKWSNSHQIIHIDLSYICVVKSGL